MGAFDVDTAVTPTGTGRFTATVSRDWEIWGPNGGYLASIALRTAGAYSGLIRPASFAAHFLGVADFAPVELTARTLRRSKRTESVAVSMTQGDRAILEALVWFVGETDGLVHDAWTRPTVPDPDAVAPMEERLGPDQPMFPFWNNLECRPCAWIDDWDARPPGSFHEQSWYRFRPTATFADPVLDAARALLVLDTVFWPAAARGYPGVEDWYAPSIDVQARFHALAPDDEFLLSDAHSPASHDGLLGGSGAIWSESGALLATGGQQMLWRPRHLNPNPEQRG
ncbi:MAG: acyl-CoA thioesterase [Acidimicrobiia bacterium]